MLDDRPGGNHTESVGQEEMLLTTECKANYLMCLLLNCCDKMLLQLVHTRNIKVLAVELSFEKLNTITDVHSY